MPGSGLLLLVAGLATKLLVLVLPDLLAALLDDT
jgi:hypothetical protein